MTKPKIMLVDDEALVLAFMEELLLDAGYDVMTASHGEQAILDFGESNLCCLVTDVRMPGMGGWVLAREAREAFPNLPVIYVSGDSAADWRDQGVKNSIMIAKPFHPDVLVRALRGLIPSSSARHCGHAGAA